MNKIQFERLLDELCHRLTRECAEGQRFTVSKSFENRVREVLRTLLTQYKIPVDFSPHPYGFPDIVLGKHGVEVKFWPFLLTYHGILATRDAFSAGSAAGPERGGIYVQKALQRIETQMIAAAEYMEGSLLKEYWGRDVPPARRIREWLKMADVYAKVANPPWEPSAVLFLSRRPKAREN